MDTQKTIPIGDIRAHALKEPTCWEDYAIRDLLSRIDAQRGWVKSFTDIWDTPEEDAAWAHLGDIPTDTQKPTTAAPVAALQRFDISATGEPMRDGYGLYVLQSDVRAAIDAAVAAERLAIAEHFRHESDRLAGTDAMEARAARYVYCVAESFVRARGNA